MEDELDLDASMEETLNELRKGDDVQSEDDPEATETPEVPEEPETPEGDSAPEQPVAETEAEPAASDDDLEPDGEAEPTPSDTDASLVNPPTTWRAAAKAKWANVDPDIKAEIHKRELDSVRGVQQLKESASFGDQMNRIIQPYMATIRARGATAEQATETMLNAYYTLETAPPMGRAQALLQTAQQYGCISEIQQLISNQGQMPQQQPVDIQAEIDKALSLQRQQNDEAKAQKAVQAFSTAVNDDGTLKYPYFENVKAQMGAILGAEDVSLEEAYERAIWATPDIRQILQSQQAAEEEAKRQAEAKARAEKAKKADSLNLGKKPSHEHAEQSEPTSVEDTMRQELEKIKARAS